MLKDKTIKELDALKELAIKQDNKINLSMILITLDNFKDELSEVMDYFEQNGIEIINEDKRNQCKDNLRNLWKNLPLMHVPPEFFKLIKFNNNIFFFVPPSFKITSTNSGTIKHNNHNNIINSLIHFDFFIQQHKQIMSNFILL